jgi:hypothetical protein
MKDFFKLLAPYIATIGSAIALYANFQTMVGVLEYRTNAMEERTKGVVEDIGSIKILMHTSYMRGWKLTDSTMLKRTSLRNHED